MVSHENTETKWILDSGCSFHMTPNKSWFEELDEQVGVSVLLGNNKSCEITGIGSVRFKLHDGAERVIKNVRLVPDLKRNLISLSEFDKQGYVFKGENGVLKVLKGSMIFMKGMQKNSLYSFIGEVVMGSTTVVSVKRLSKTELWHRRLGHMSERGLIELGKQNLLCGDKVEKLDFCEHCVYGKACRVKFGTR